MKTINQVLLALIFAVFSTAGFAQSKITLPVNTVLLNDDIRFDDFTDDDDDDDDNEDDDSVYTDVEEEVIRTLTQSDSGHHFQNSPYAAWTPRRD